MRNSRVVLLLVLGLLTPLLAACVDFGAPNDAANAQDRARLNRPTPTATELPPGLGDDLPPPPTTQPMTPTR